MINTGSSESIGRVIKYHRRRSGLSQAAFADLAGVGKTSVFDIEKGKATVRLSTLMPVLKTLNINVLLESPLMDEYLETTSEQEPASVDKDRL
jgi:HTH-type transcriptional regulator / antitoxin HipB